MASGLGWSWDWIDGGWERVGTDPNVCVKGKQNWLQRVIMLHRDRAVSHDLLEVCLSV